MPPHGQLLLGPGHLGEPRDLSLRVVQALRDADLVLIEEGSDHGHAHILKRLDLPARPVASVPDQGLPDALRAQVLGVLDAGGTVLLFGVDEGIPAYADPGAVIVRLVRDERPSTPIRSLGGSSVLGAAMLACGLTLQRVTLLGVTTSPPPQREEALNEAVRWARRLADEPHALALLTTGADAVELAGRLHARRELACQLVICASLTRPEERVYEGVPEAILAEPPPPTAPCVVFVRAQIRRTHPLGWLLLVSRLFG